MTDKNNLLIDVSPYDSDNDDNRLKTDKRLQYNLSNPSPKQKEQLNIIRQKSWPKRLFRGFQEGSLRGVVITWMRMTLGIGILVLPNYFKQFGVVTAIIVLAVAYLCNLLANHFIFEANSHTGAKDYETLITDLLGPRMTRIFRATIIIDISQTITVYSIVSWNLCEYIMYFFKIGEEHWKDWFIDEKKMIFNEMHPTIFLIRTVFFTVLFIILVPFLLQKRLAALQKVTIMYLVGLFLLLAIILAEVPSFHKAYKDEDIGFEYFKPFDVSWIEYFFGVIMSFYIQPFVFSLRKELLEPSLKRKKKVATISMSLEVVLFIIIGFFCYFALGDEYTPHLVILRTPYPDKNKISEIIFRAIIGVFFIINSIGLPVFNITLREYIHNLFSTHNTKLFFRLTSLLPYLTIFVLAVVYPYVVGIINFFGFTVCNFNGFIIPALLKIAILKERKASKFKIFLCYLFTIFLGGMGMAALLFRLIGWT